VSGAGNLPDPSQGLEPGMNGIFDPTVTHSGQAGSTVGPYVLNLAVQPENHIPTVRSVMPGEGSALAGPPTHLVVHFAVTTDLLVQPRRWRGDTGIADQGTERTATPKVPLE